MAKGASAVMDLSGRAIQPALGGQPGGVRARRVEVTAPSRLHFGLLAFGRATGRQYGGAGVMIDRPALRLRVTAAEGLQATGPLAARARDFASRWATSVGLSFDALRTAGCRIEVRSAAPPHCGLGVGTQLALSVATALTAWFGHPPLAPAELAHSMGRGRRSAVGAYGFATGGLIVERGRLGDEPISPLKCRLRVPDEWRFVLIRPSIGPGLAGSAEQTAFDRLPPVPPEVTARLWREVDEQMLPALRQRDFARFSVSVYRYGRLAGCCFETVQGGPYNGPRLTRIVELVRDLGATGVGQSSWGPTLFALLPDERQARTFRGQLIEALGARLNERDVRVSIARPDNRGATLAVWPSDAHAAHPDAQAGGAHDR